MHTRTLATCCDSDDIHFYCTVAFPPFFLGGFIFVFWSHVLCFPFCLLCLGLFGFFPSSLSTRGCNPHLICPIILLPNVKLDRIAQGTCPPTINGDKTETKELCEGRVSERQRAALGLTDC